MMQIETEYNDFDYWIDPAEQQLIRQEFKKVFELFVAHNYPKQKETLMCSIHESFHGEGHNCVACNLENSSKLIANYLKYYNTFETIQSVFTTYLWFLYLMTTRMEEYIDIMSLPEGIKQKKFGTFQKVKRWANFIKHPKAFMFVHHPCYSFEGTPFPLGYDNSQHVVVINDEFVKEFYSGSKNNRKLLDHLVKKEGVIVEFPNPVILMQEFVIAQKNFVELICDNKMIRELLDDKATRYYELEDKKI
jgi:hypothetical protein